MNKNIVILGGGFGGLRVAKELARMPEVVREHHLILIDRNSHHLYTPLLYEVASALLQEHAPAEQYCLRNGVCVDFAFLQKVSLRDRVEFVHGEVTALDIQKREIALGKKKIPYTYCVVALGAETEDFGIPGVRQHGHMFKTMQDAMTIHKRILELLRRKREGKERKVTIVIGGGGPTGVELAAELSSFCMRACAKYDLSFNDFLVTVVEANNRLLSVLDPKISAWTLERLQHLGVNVWRDTCVKKVTKGAVTIAPRPLCEGEERGALVCDFRGENDKKLEADIFIWSGGIRAPTVLNKSGLLLDGKGRVDVHDTLRAKGNDSVFALGDCAALLDPTTHRVVPGLGQVAVLQAPLVAENIRRALVGRHLHSYTYPPLAHLIPVGGKYAFGQFGTFCFRGFFMWIARRLADLRYFFSILSLRYAVRTWWDGWRMYTKND